MAHVDRKQYWKVFGVLFALTILEVGVAVLPGVPRTALVLALVGMALTKAGVVGYYFMHLGHETRVMKLTVAVPFAAPAIYAVVLISEAAWRLIWPTTP